MRIYFLLVLIIEQEIKVFSESNNEVEINLTRNSRSPQGFENWPNHGDGKNHGGRVHFVDNPYGEQGGFNNGDPHHQGRGHHAGGHHEEFQFPDDRPDQYNGEHNRHHRGNQHHGDGHHGEGHHGDGHHGEGHHGDGRHGEGNHGDGHHGGGHHGDGHHGDWRPRRPHGRPPPPDGYSGYRPEGWGHGGYTYDENGDKERRKSQIKFEEYMRQIYGSNFTEENSVLTPEELNGRKIAAPGEFRHMAVIGLRGEDRTKEWKCGGSLIDVHFVLTAAHCTDFGGQPPTHVKIGDINLKVREDTVSTQRMKIADIYVHPKYKSNSYYYDIALIRLSKPAVFTRHVRPARLWSSSEIPYELAFAMGYGATTFGRAPTEVLTFFNLTLIGNKDCNTSLPINDDTPNGIIESQICALDKDGVKDTCQGDSGGPLQLHLPGRRRTRYYLIGITSYGLFCGSKTPSVYTRIFPFLDWIEQIVWP